MLLSTSYNDIMKIHLKFSQLIIKHTMIKNKTHFLRYCLCANNKRLIKIIFYNILRYQILKFIVILKCTGSYFWLTMRV